MVANCGTNDPFSNQFFESMTGLAFNILIIKPSIMYVLGTVYVTDYFLWWFSANIIVILLLTNLFITLPHNLIWFCSPSNQRTRRVKKTFLICTSFSTVAGWPIMLQFKLSCPHTLEKSWLPVRQTLLIQKGKQENQETKEFKTFKKNFDHLKYYNKNNREKL